jgi:hypothetical protein
LELSVEASGGGAPTRGGEVSEAKKKFRLAHQVGDVVTALGQLRDFDAGLGRQYEELPLANGIERAVEAGLH